jgi:replication factor A3
MSEATPRINASYLEHFSHRTVRILGKVKQIRGESATIDAGGDITMHLNKVSPPTHALQSRE